METTRAIGVMTRLKRSLPSITLKILYCSLILPHILYGVLVWGFDIQKIEILQKKAVRLIDKAFFLSHTDPIFKKYKLLKVQDIVKARTLNFYYRLVDGILPSSLYNIASISNVSFNSGGSLSSHIHNLSTYNPVTRAAEKCLRFSLPVLINTCTEEILSTAHTKSEISYNLFVKNYFISLYSDLDCTRPDCYACRLRSRYTS